MKPIFHKIHCLFFNSYPFAFSVFSVFFTAVLIFINYHFNLNEYLVHAYSQNSLQIILYFFIYFSAFIICFVAYSFFTKAYKFWQQKLFWIIAISAPLIFGFQQYFYQYQNFVTTYFSTNSQAIYLTTFEWLCRSIILLSYSFLIWKITQRNDENNFSTNNVSVPKNMYWYMIAIIVPFVVLAASTPSFQEAYPKIKTVLNHEPSLAKAFHFEAAYTLNFIAIEVFFRYILIIVLAKYCGPACIMAMATFYCTIHFGKPLTECVSSFFGGILLGIIAYEYKTIKGGILLHLTIAYTMELAGNWFIKPTVIQL